MIKITNENLPKILKKESGMKVSPLRNRWGWFWTSPEKKVKAQFHSYNKDSWRPFITTDCRCYLHFELIENCEDI